MQNRPAVGVASREGAWTLLWSSLLVSSKVPSPKLGQSWLLPDDPAAYPHSPTRTPMQSGAGSGRQSEGAGWAHSEHGDNCLSLHESSTLWGTLPSPDCVCAYVCVCMCMFVYVYLPSNLSIYIYACRNVGAKEVGGGHFSGPQFSAPRLGLPSTSGGVTPQGFHHRQIGPPSSSTKAYILEIVLYDDVCHRVENKLDVTGVSGAGEVGVDLLGLLVAVQVLKLPLDVDSGLLVGVLALVLREADGERDAPDLFRQQVLLVQEEDE